MYSEEKTEVIYGAEKIINVTLERYAKVKESVDNCTDSNGPSMFVIPNHPITKAYIDMKKKGVRLRFIAEVTKDNISYCKELMKVVELRHLDEVKGNFGIVDGIYYSASAKVKESSPPPLLVDSTVKALVEQQQYFFEMLWRKAIPAKQRIKEIEEGAKREFIETIRDPYETQKIFNDLLKLANEEILITLPATIATTAAHKRLSRYEQEHLLPLLRDAVEHKVNLRLLVDESAIEQIRGELLSSSNGSNLIKLQALDKQHQNKVITAIVDGELCLTVEVRGDSDNDNSDSTIEVLGLATYSNSESTVLSYISIFETLWLQAEIKNKQKKITTIT